MGVDTGQASLSLLREGAEKAFDNAEQLFREAEILAAAGAVSRALCLHQISLEECSKVGNLGAWAMSLVLGHEVNQKKVLAAFGRHEAKNKSNAYMLPRSEAEEDAIARGDWGAALAAFNQTQEEFHGRSNWAKNASLYVDWVDGAFVAPAERISGEMLVETRERNAKFMGYAQNGVNTLKRLDASADVMRDLLVTYVEQMEELRAEKPDDLIAGADKLLADFLEAGKARLLDKK